MSNKYKAYNKQWKLANADQERRNCKRWFENNKEHRRQYKRDFYARSKSDPNFRLKKALRGRFSKIIKGIAKQKSILKYVGCSIEDLRLHLEQQFRDGMNWGNYGTCWHIDHIVPLCRFDHTEESQIYKAWNYMNLQPLFSEENLRKGSK